ncbi:hypothetical protein [Nitriliruptor alkaliphilus]|uniref:hypothetical protein n=1 Tax=Nitriliruptor alkaliphilus TaxID=427918 RepID=UPI00069631C4|nr:hypothetical protein [Nitriliruptor alkaliphilus]
MTTLAAHPTAGDTLADLTPPTTPLAAVPVALDLRGRAAEAVRRAVEAHGWQAVDEATAALVPPVVRLADVAAPAGDGTPTVLLVAADDAAPVAASACLRLQPTAVVPWPDEDGVLVDIVLAATSAPRRATSSAALLRVGGAAGGVGTTTVALALAGLAAWRGQPTLVTSGDAVLLPSGTPGIDPSALTAPDLWSRASAIEGVPGARAVRTSSPPFDATVSDPSVATAVLDLGVADEVDVLVLRPDAAGAAALERTAAAAVVVVGDGPVAPRALTAAVGARRRVDLPWSHRIARAALVGRVPAALPGRAVRALLPLVPAGPSG